MGRSPSDKNGLKKGPWTPEEDMKLTDYIQTHGAGNWRNLPKNAGLDRCGKSCRLRWTNYLRPDIKRGRFSFEEEETIIQLHSVLGNKWSAIAARLPGRTDNEIKNYWNTHIRKRLLRNGIDPVTHAPRLDLLDLSSLLNSPHHSISNLLRLQTLLNPEALRLAMSLISSANGNNLQTQSQIQMAPLIQPNHFDNIITQPNTHTFNQSQSQMFDNNLMLPTTSDRSTLPSDVVPSFSYGNSDQLRPDLSENSSFQSMNSGGGGGGGNYNGQSLGLDSDLSTPISSPPLLSASDFISGSTEDERDSFCSDLFRFEIPEFFDFNEFM